VANRQRYKEKSDRLSQSLCSPGLEGTDDPFLALFPHRFDYIFAGHCAVGESPQWQTESRHPLSDRLIHQGSFLYGVRFSSQTRYCLIDIDYNSSYHPNQDPQAISRIVEVLEPLGLVAHIPCTSSYSGGIHLYFPFESQQKTWQIALALQTLLENAGFHITPGQLELFPNVKPFVTEGHPSLYAAHRLPLQIGSYLLNQDWQPTYTSRSIFLNQWQFAQSRNLVDTAQLEQILRATRRRHYGLSGKADKFLNDLNAEIEAGWSDFGQTNYILGRIAMRSYVFGHILYGSQPLQGKLLVDDIIRVATSLPGYQQWCRHQHEIEKRAEEWARSVEASHYFHFRYRRKQSRQLPDHQEQSLSWNQRQQKGARDRIRGAIADLLNKDVLPTTATARFHALLEYGIGGSSLYRHRDLWHPAHLQSFPEILSVENPPNPPASSTACDWESIGDASQSQDSPSLLDATGCNEATAAIFSVFGAIQNHDPGRNFLSASAPESKGASADPPNLTDELRKDTPRWIQMVLWEIQREKAIARTAVSPTQRQLSNRAVAHQQAQAERMQAYLESGDPILIAEAQRQLTGPPPLSVDGCFPVAPPIPGQT
jgi:hypothetical protein